MAKKPTPQLHTVRVIRSMATAKAETPATLAKGAGIAYSRAHSLLRDPDPNPSASTVERALNWLAPKWAIHSPKWSTP